MDIEEVIRRGAAASTLLGSDDFKLALEAVRAEAFKGWVSTQPSDKDAREEYYYLALATAKVTELLKFFVDERTVEVAKQKQKEQERTHG